MKQLENGWTDFHEILKYHLNLSIKVGWKWNPNSDRISEWNESLQIRTFYWKLSYDPPNGPIFPEEVKEKNICLVIFSTFNFLLSCYYECQSSKILELGQCVQESQADAILKCLMGFVKVTLICVFSKVRYFSAFILSG